MTKRKQTDKIRSPQKHQKQIPQKPKNFSLKKIFSSIYFWLGVCFFVVSSILSYYSSLPKIKITPDISLDPSDPSSTSFLFENESIFPVHKFEYQFYLRDIIINRDRRISSIFMKSKEPPLDNFNSSQSFSDFIVFPFDLGTDSRWLSADIDIEITYRPMFWPRNKTTSTRFIGKSDINGNLKWIVAKPLDDLPPLARRSVLIFSGKRKY